MEKNEYEKLLKDRPWEQIESFFGNKSDHTPELVTQININPQDWQQFTVDNWENVQIKWEYEKPFYTEEENWLVSMNELMGRNKGNTCEYNFGMNGDTNEKLVALLGDDNIKKLGLIKESILIRLILHSPGHGAAWHKDNPANSYRLKFPDLDHDKNEIVRYWFSAIDWKNGQVFQIGNKVLSHWKAGDVYQIPFGVPHASMNFGYNFKYTIALTGMKRA
jgi:hypothetical protein